MIRTVLIALLTAGLLVACGNPASEQPAPKLTPTPRTSDQTSEQAEPRVLLLEATGTATLTTLTFTLDGEGTEQQGVTLPWSRTIEIPPGPHEWRLTMKHSGGTLFATATVDGKLLTQTGASSSPGGNSTANLSGSFS